MESNGLTNEKKSPLIDVPQKSSDPLNKTRARLAAEMYTMNNYETLKNEKPDLEDGKLS